MKYTVPLGEALGHTPSVKILNFLLAHSHDDYSQKEIAEATGLVRQTVANGLPRLMWYHLVTPSRQIGKTMMYRFKEGTKQAKAFRAFMDALIDVVVKEEQKKMKDKK